MLLSEYATQIDFGHFEVREAQDEHLLSVAGYLYQVYGIINLVEVAIEYLSELVNTQFVIAYVQRRRASSGYYVD